MTFTKDLKNAIPKFMLQIAADLFNDKRVFTVQTTLLLKVCGQGQGKNSSF